MRRPTSSCGAAGLREVMTDELAVLDASAPLTAFCLRSSSVGMEATVRPVADPGVTAIGVIAVVMQTPSEDEDYGRQLERDLYEEFRKSVEQGDVEKGTDQFGNEVLTVTFTVEFTFTSFSETQYAICCKCHKTPTGGKYCKGRCCKKQGYQ
jgi:hypothetical protein